MRVVLDTNIVVRAACPAGNARLIMDVLPAGGHTLITSSALLVELQRALWYPRVRHLHRLSDADLQVFVAAYHKLAEIVPDQATGLSEIVRDPTDLRVLSVAVAGRADALCTGDADLLTSEIKDFAKSHGFAILREVELLRQLQR